MMWILGGGSVEFLVYFFFIPNFLCKGAKNDDSLVRVEITHSLIEILFVGEEFLWPKSSPIPLIYRLGYIIPWRVTTL